MLPHETLPVILWGTYYYSFHFSDEKTENWRNKISICAVEASTGKAKLISKVHILTRYSKVWIQAKILIITIYPHGMFSGNISWMSGCQVNWGWHYHTIEYYYISAEYCILP